MSAIVKNMLLNEAQKMHLAEAINDYGSGQHPVANNNTIDYFQVPYAIDCLGRMYHGKIGGHFRNEPETPDPYLLQLHELHESIVDKVDDLLIPEQVTNNMVFTKEQVMAIFDRWVMRADADKGTSFISYIGFAKPVFGGDGAIDLPWCGMHLCIETDGHTHS